jgi:hypothetical protein
LWRRAAVLLLADMGWGDAGGPFIGMAIDSKWVVWASGNPGPILKVAK